MNIINIFKIYINLYKYIIIYYIIIKISDKSHHGITHVDLNA